MFYNFVCVNFDWVDVLYLDDCELIVLLFVVYDDCCMWNGVYIDLNLMFWVWNFFIKIGFFIGWLIWIFWWFLVEFLCKVELSVDLINVGIWFNFYLFCC